MRKVQEVKSFGFRKYSRNFLGSLLMLQEVEILPTLVLFYSRGRGCLAVFFLKGMFGKIMDYGNSAMF